MKNRRKKIGTSDAIVITRHTNQPGIDRARSRSTAASPARTTSSAGTLKISGAGIESRPSARTAVRENSVFTGPGHSAVTETPVSRNSARNASEKLVTYAFDA